MEESKIKKTNMGMNIVRSYEQEERRFKKRSSNQDSPMVNKYRVSNPNFQERNKGESSFKRYTCVKCRKQHLSKCLAGPDDCFGYENKGHKMRDYPTLSAKRRESKHDSNSTKLWSLLCTLI